MPTFNYGGRNGMSTLLKMIRALCHLYIAFSAGIVEYINASSLTSEEKTALINWLNTAQAMCALIEAIRFVYE